MPSVPEESDNGSVLTGPRTTTCNEHPPSPPVHSPVTCRVERLPWQHTGGRELLPWLGSCRTALALRLVQGSW